MRVTGRDQYHAPERGIVLAHSPSRAAISAVLALEPRRWELPPGVPVPSYYTFNAFPRTRPAETIEEARARFARQRATAEEARIGAQRT